MKGPRWLASPVTGTVAVLAVLGLLASPLRKLTSTERDPAVRIAPAATAAKEVHAILRLRLLAPAKRLVVKTSGGAALVETRELVAGESEYDAMVPFADGGLDLTVQADFGAASAETAVFLTVMPDGYDDQTRYVIGTGLIEELLRYEWHPH